MRSHREPINMFLHLIGIGLMMVAVLTFSKDWRWAIALLIAGVFIQEAGHTIENTRRIKGGR